MAHKCVMNGHVAILGKILEIDSNVASVSDSKGNLPLHTLCLNVMNTTTQLQHMLAFLHKANPKAISVTNNEDLTPIEVL